ncbi:MAG: hypothetical protein KGJ60_12275 [Verrucomicrobiota bacterium]|nr:hypothetical protein [Verrucomicrobiota bacterium]
MRTLRGHVPAAVARFHLHPVGSLSGSKRLNLAIGLPLRNQPTLAELLRQLYDPASGHYHHFLTPAQFTEQFGPSAQEYQAVLDFTGTNGLVVTATHSDRLLLDVSGTVADVERTFHLTLRLYRHPMENRVFYAPDTEPSAPAEVPILDISGLDNFARPRPLLKVIPRSEAGARPAAGSGPFGDFIGKDFRAAYAPDVLLDGAGESVGLVEFDGFYSNDIASYEGQAGLPEVPLQTVLLDGVSGSPGSGNVEVALDIEMAISMAPGLSQVVVFEGNTANDILNAMAASNQIQQLSSSWTWGGGPSATTDNILRKMATEGQSFFQASGDSDAYDSTIDQSSQVNEPVDSPYLTSVGGTTLTTSGARGSWTSETAWNWGYDASANPPGDVGTGGGISTYYSIPAWQAGLDMTGNQGSTAYRNIPDVALTADNIFVEADNGQQESVGGTSAAAPLWAGFIALANQQAAAAGRSAVGFINPAVYAIGGGPRYAADFHDITTGNNTNDVSPAEFFAVPGYDLCTGWGTPAGQNLINDLAGPPDALAVTPITGFAASGPIGGPFSVTSQAFLLTNLDTTPLNWSLGNASPWLDVSPTGGTLPGGGEATVTADLNGAASNLAAGAYTADVWFTNQASGVAQDRRFTLQVLQPLVVTPSWGFTANGPVGGPFDVTMQNLSLTNIGTAPLDWSVINTSLWINVSSAGGTLTPAGQDGVTVSLNDANADSLAAGIYTAALWFTNQTDGGAVSNVFTLRVGQPLIQNGGFETGDFTGWTLDGDRANINFVTGPFTIGPRDRFRPHSGGYAAALGEPYSFAYLSQTLPTATGQLYWLSLWMDSPDGQTPNEFSVIWNSETLFDQVNIPNIGWTNLQFLVKATVSSTVLEFAARDDPTYLGLDDVSVTPVAAPVFRLVEATNNSFQLVWEATTGLVYQVQYKTNLLQGTWINLGNPITATSNTITVSDPNALTASPERFYRITVSP